MVPTNIPSCSQGNSGGRPLRHRDHLGPTDPSVYPVVGGQSGIIASYTSRALGVGTTVACPWVIVAQPGERINLTLMSFADGKSSGWCNEYAVVAEQTEYRDIGFCHQRASASVSC